MKKNNRMPHLSVNTCIIVLCLFFQTQAVHTQEETKYFTLMGGLGTNNILIQGTSFGLIWDTNFLFLPKLASGIKGDINFSSDEITSMATEVYARWNFWRPNIDLPFYNDEIAVFAQAGLGLFTAYKGTNVQDSRASILLDAAIGANIPLPDRWCVETSFRFGYPFIIGFNLTAGYRFPSLQKTETRVEYREIPPNEIIRKVLISQVEYIIFAANISIYNKDLDASTRSLNDLILNQITKTLTEHPEFRIRIEGHANPVTSNPKEAEELYRLSSVRANEISKLLISRGVKEEQIVLMAHGGTRTITSTREEWSRNRRVELMVIQVNTEKQENVK